MKILILGGDGFIGSHLRNAHLVLGDSVTIVDKNNIRSNSKSKDYTFYDMDLSWKPGQDIFGLCRIYRPDFIYNCVAVATPAYYVKHPIETFELDFEVNKNILDELHHQRTPFIHFSTSEVYGKTWTKPYTESSDCTIGPATKQRWIYATSKILLDQYILASKMNCCIVRPFNFIGHDIDWLPDIDKAISQYKTWIPRVPSCFLNALLTNQKLQIVNPGTQQRCYTHIDDAINGLLAIEDNWNTCKGEIINLGNPKNEISIEGLAGKMQSIYFEITNKSPKGVSYIDGEKLYGKGYEDSERRLFSDDKMKKLTGWKAAMNLEQTLRSTIKDAIDAFDSTK